MEIAGTPGAAPSLSEPESESAFAGNDIFGIAWRVPVPFASRPNALSAADIGSGFVCARLRESFRGGRWTTTGGGGWGNDESVKTEPDESAERGEGRTGGEVAAPGAGDAG